MITLTRPGMKVKPHGWSKGTIGEVIRIDGQPDGSQLIRVGIRGTEYHFLSSELDYVEGEYVKEQD